MTTPRNDGLPELPEPKSLGHNGVAEFFGYTEDQMRAYGANCRRWVAGDSVPAAYCNPSDPFPGTAFSWPGLDHSVFAHPAPLYTAGQMRAYGESCRRASPSAAQPLLSREPEPVSNASVTVGGVRVPGPMELNEANLLRYGADYLDGWNSYDEHLRLNPAAEVGEEEDLANGLTESAFAMRKLFNGQFHEWHRRAEEADKAAALLRRLAGSGKEDKNG